MSTVQSFNYDMLLLYYMGTNYIAIRNRMSTRRDSRALGKTIQEHRWIFLNPLINRERHWKIQACIKTQLQDWCLFQNFDFYIGRRDFHVQSVLGPVGIHLSQWGKCAFTCRLAGLINGTSNYNLWGK